MPSLSDQRLENQINYILESSNSADCFDRLLSQEETNAFFSELEASRSEDSELWNDVYGSAHLQLSILFSDGTKENINKTSKNTHRFLNTVAELAMIGLNQE